MRTMYNGAEPIKNNFLLKLYMASLLNILPPHLGKEPGFKAFLKANRMEAIYISEGKLSKRAGSGTEKHGPLCSCSNDVSITEFPNLSGCADRNGGEGMIPCSSICTSSVYVRPMLPQMERVCT